MARITQSEFSGQSDANHENRLEIDATGQNSVKVPNSQFIADAEISRDGQDLVLEAPNGETVIIQNYFNGGESPLIESPDGSILTSNLVHSFLQSDPQFAQMGTINDESPVGAVEEMKGEATVIRADGSSESLTLGSPIFQGDTIETNGNGAVNIVFMDETSMAVSENARLSVDEYQFDPATESGETNLSVLRGVFVFTSGLIGRDDPDDVMIDTPVGSIGIRGTIIAGKIQPGGESEVTVVEGAIYITNGAGEITLSQQYEGVKLGGFNDNMQGIGVQSAENVGKTYGSVSDVVPKLFSSINDNIKAEAQAQEKTEEVAEDALESTEENLEAEPEQVEEAPQPEVLLEQIIEPEVLLSEKPVDVLIDKQEIKKDSLLNKSNGRKGLNSFDTEQINPNQVQEQPLKINSSGVNLFEGAQAGSVIGRVVSNGGKNGAVSLNFANGSTISTDGYYEIFQIGGRIANIKLTTAGKSALDASTIGMSLSANAFVIVATDSNGVQKTLSFNPVIQDAVINLNTAGGIKNFDVEGGINLGPQKIGDYNGDGVEDYISADYAANTVQLIDGNTHSQINLFAGALGINSNSIDSIGDINNDGYADFVIGSPDVSGIGNIKIATGAFSGSPFTTINTGQTGDGRGTAVAGIGDFDGDGKSDYAYTSPGVDGDAADKGAVFIKFGDGTDATVLGHLNNMRLGGHINGLGDINRDGLSDILITAENIVGGNYEAYIINGGTSPTDTSSVTKISIPHEIVAGGSTGDLNGDGFDDFAVSFKMGNDINTFILFGKNTLPSTIDMTYLESPDNALKIHHAGAGGAAEYQVTSLGDTNGDGFDDIQLGIVGGEQFIVHGNLAGNAPYVMDNAPNDGDATTGKIEATANDQSLVGDVHFLDDNFTGLSMRGGVGNNHFSIKNTNFKNIDGGDGIDTIKYGGGAGGTLDFTAVNFEKISQIERIQLFEDNATIRLTAENIFNLLKSSDNGSLTIDLTATTGSLNIDMDGTPTNIVDALNEQGVGATQQADVTQNGNTYEHYQIGGYDLYIDTDISTTVI